jgi:cobalt-zinc-cadmium efflux system outer membrane protein
MAVLLAAALEGGCVTYPSEEDTFRGVQDLVAARGIERIVWNRGSEADAEVERAVEELLQPELTVEAAMQIALLNNRRLQATFEELGIAQADLVQAGLLSNPVFMGEVRFPPHPHTPYELDVSQDFLDVLLRPLRKQVAEAQFEGVKLQVAQAVIELASQVRAAYFTLQGAEQALDMRRSIALAFEASADAARRLHDAGNITELELANEQAALGEARIGLAEAEVVALDAREALVSLLGLWGARTEFSVAPRLPDLPLQEIPPEDIESLAVSQRLDLAGSWAEVEALAHALGLEDYAAWRQGIEGTVHVEREPGGATTIGPSLAIPIPLFDDGTAARARAFALLRQGEQRHAALAVEIRSEARRARARMFSARQRAEFYRDDLLPLRSAIVDQTQLEYNAMLVGVFQLLQARRAEIEAGQASIDALRDYWIERTALERAVGGRLAEAGVSPAPEPPPERVPAPENTEHHHPGT